MRADYDSQADAISIDLADGVDRWDGGTDEVHDRCTVAIAAGRPVNVEVLYPNQGINEPLAAAADRYNLDLQALTAAASSALAAPDREVRIDVRARALA